MYIVYKIFENQSHRFRVSPTFLKTLLEQYLRYRISPHMHTYAHTCRCESLESSPSVFVREWHVKPPGCRYRGRRVYCKRDACNWVRIMWKKRITFLTILRRLAVLLEFGTEGNIIWKWKHSLSDIVFDSIVRFWHCCMTVVNYWFRRWVKINKRLVSKKSSLYAFVFIHKMVEHRQ